MFLITDTIFIYIVIGVRSNIFLVLDMENMSVSSRIRAITKRALEIADIEESDSELDSDDSYVVDDEMEVSDHDSESEMEIVEDESSSDDGDDENENKYFGKKKLFYLGKNRVLCSSQTRQHHIIKFWLSTPEEPVRALGNEATPKQIWDQFFTQEIIDEIVKHTNVKRKKLNIKIPCSTKILKKMN